MTNTHDCGRCGASLNLHWSRPRSEREMKVWIGCPFPRSFLLDDPTCGYGHCMVTDVDSVLGLCAEHLVRAHRGLATKRW